MGLTIGKISKMFHVSRTTLLYYDKIGLLSSSQKTDTGYRIYDDACVKRLSRIMLLREVGISLERIKEILSVEETEIAGLLMKRLGDINAEISRLKTNQLSIIEMLGNTSLADILINSDMVALKKILRQAGVITGDNKTDEEQMKSWHQNFERVSPEEHKHLLEMLKQYS